MVLLLLLLATIGNFLLSGTLRSAVQKGRVGIADEDESGTDYGDYGAVVKVIGVLGTPFVFAMLLNRWFYLPLLLYRSHHCFTCERRVNGRLA